MLPSLRKRAAKSATRKMTEVTSNFVATTLCVRNLYYFLSELALFVPTRPGLFAVEIFNPRP
jgi:hypothetical protein